jgi:hypothetical protein
MFLMSYFTHKMYCSGTTLNLKWEYKDADKFKEGDDVDISNKIQRFEPLNVLIFFCCDFI